MGACTELVTKWEPQVLWLKKKKKVKWEPQWPPLALPWSAQGKTQA